MKSIITITILLLLVSCQPQNKIALDVPWHISERINNDRVFNYNYADSLKVYEKLNESTIENLGNYYSYLADLNFKINPSEITKPIDLLNKAFTIDTVGFCEELILEAHEYLNRNDRPAKNYTIPFIIELDLDYFLKKLDECQPIIQDKELTFDLKKDELSLRIAYIMIKDQWFRIPNRKGNNEAQMRYDTENQKELDRLFTISPFPKENEDIRYYVQILLLHSENCDWTKK